MARLYIGTRGMFYLGETFGDPLYTPYIHLIDPLFFRIQNLGMWGMYSGVKTYEKHDGDNEKILGSSGDPLLTPYRPLIA